MKVISYSLFGYKRKHAECFEFERFLEMFFITLRSAHNLYPDWRVRLHLETTSYLAYQDLFDELAPYIDIELKEPTSLCRAMLWRVEPVQYAEYTICRDIDSLHTHRERRCVEQWLQDGTWAHAINDSLGHGIEMLGGMIGFKSLAFTCPIVGNFEVKGSDQTWLCDTVFPKLQSVTQHVIKGFDVNLANKYCRTDVPNIETGVEEFADCDNLVNHIGQGGFHLYEHTNGETGQKYEGAAVYWLKRGDMEFNNNLRKIEDKWPQIFTWVGKL